MAQTKFRSIPDMFMHRVRETPSDEAYRFPVGDQWRSLTWYQAFERVRDIAGGLQALGLTPEQTVGLCCSTRYEWILADLGILSAGGATTTVYPSSTAEDSAYILADAGVVFAIVEDAGQLAKLQEQRASLSKLARVIVIDPMVDKDKAGGPARANGKSAPAAGGDDWVMTLEQLEALGRSYHANHPDRFDETVRAIRPEQLATLIYTSGTTGKPKGVRLVHEGWCYEAQVMHELGMMSADDVQYLWLPLSHSFGKVMQVGQIYTGYATAVDGRIPKLVENLAVVRPTFMAAAPRIFEKVYNKVVSGAKEAGGLKYAIFKWAVSVGARVSKQRQIGREPRGWLALLNRIADRLVFSKLRAKFGGRIRFFISGSAPLSKEIAEFFHGAGILILEGYGLTETSAATFVNRIGSYRFGSVGLPMPGTEVKIAKEDGEILLRGPGVMRGYHNLADKTAEVMTDDGWFRTGDIGEVTADGFLRITDRKKDLIKTSGGKYVAPQLIEGKLKAICPFVSQVVVHGDRRKYCTALLTLDEETLRNWAKDQGMNGASYEDLTKKNEVHALIQPYIDELNQGLARYESIKKFALLPRDLTVEEGELTPSLKVKRKVVETKYSSMLDGMYEDATVAL